MFGLRQFLLLGAVALVGCGVDSAIDLGKLPTPSVQVAGESPAAESPAASAVDVSDEPVASAPTDRRVTEPEVVKDQPAADTTQIDEDTAAAHAARPATPIPGKVEILIKERNFVPDSKTKSLRIAFKDLDLLQVMNMSPVTMDAVEKMPAWLRELDGKRVIVRGFMRTAFVDTGLTNFVMVGDVKLCCFGPNVKVHDLIEVHMAPGVTTDYIEMRPFDLTGVFHIELKESDGMIYGLYSIDQARVIRL